MLGKIARLFVALTGIVVLLVAGIALMPARAVKLATDRIDGLAVGTAEGWLWRGEADAAYRGHDLGRVAWSARPRELLDFELGTDWRIAHRDFELTGTAVVGADRVEFAASGNINGLAVNRFLAQYHIALDGMFEVDNLGVRVDSGVVTAEGRLHWSGGRAAYRLSGETHDAELPGMVGTLATVEGEPALEVVAADDSVRLMNVRLDREGWVHIGVTARLTTLAGTPWRPGDAEEAVVVTVSERLFETGSGTVPVPEG